MLPKCEEDPMFNTHIMVQGFSRKHGKCQVRKKDCIYQNSSPDSKADFSEKSLFGIWKLILGRYDIMLHIQHIILNIQYIEGHI